MIDTHDRPAPKQTSIASYHAHIYYDVTATRDKAELLRTRIGECFAVQLGRWHDLLVGPHTQPMYQVAFSTGLFKAFVPWLMLNRLGLTVLVHPNTGAPRDDHMLHSLWLGQVLPLKEDALPLHEDVSPGSPMATNTTPTESAD